LSLATIYTVGHSTLPYDQFVGLVRSVGVNAIADVRSSPYSRYHPQFNRETLKEKLRGDGISYVFLGKELGGRPSNKSLFCDGVADYEKMAAQPLFKDGLKRIAEGAAKYDIALMCSEHNPLECHRCLLVGRALSGAGFYVKHILGDGTTLDQGKIEGRLLSLFSSATKDLFVSSQDELKIAYRKQAKRVAFSEETDIQSAASVSNNSMAEQQR
jgi:uncharacterized protein (DUF488 family)